MKEFGIVYNTAYRDLDVLVRLGLLNRRGADAARITRFRSRIHDLSIFDRGRSGNYRIGRAAILRSNYRQSLDRFQKSIERVRRKGKLRLVEFLVRHNSREDCDNLKVAVESDTEMPEEIEARFECVSSDKTFYLPRPDRNYGEIH